MRLLLVYHMAQAQRLEAIYRQDFQAQANQTNWNALSNLELQGEASLQRHGQVPNSRLVLEMRQTKVRLK
jgi:hypothetical protein